MPARIAAETYPEFKNTRNVFWYSSAADTDVKQVGQKCPPQYSFPLSISKYNIILPTLTFKYRASYI